MLVKLKPVAEGQSDVAAMQAEVHALLQSVPHGSSLVMGPPLFTEKAGGYDFGLTRVFKDGADFKGASGEIAARFLHFPTSGR